MTGAFQTIYCLSSKTSSRCGTVSRDHNSFRFTLLRDSQDRRLNLCLVDFRVQLLLRILTCSLVSKLGLTLPLRVEEAIPESEERLGEVGLDTPALMVNVVISSIVGGDVLQRIPWESITAMVVDGFDSGESKEQHALTAGHPRNQVPDASTRSIQQKPFDRVVVQSTERVGYVETVVA